MIAAYAYALLAKLDPNGTFANTWMTLARQVRGSLYLLTVTCEFAHTFLPAPQLQRRCLLETKLAIYPK